MTTRSLPALSARALSLVAFMIVLAGCAQPSGPVATPTPTSTSPTSSSQTAPAADPTPAPVDSAPEGVVGTVIRFTSDRTTVDVTIGEDNPTVRDFLSLLPTEVAFEEFNGREKITYFDRELTTEGSPGSDPADGDLIYFAPWGNLGFYYDADGIGYSDSTIHIGTYDASADQLALLEGGQVTIEIIDE